MIKKIIKELLKFASNTYLHKYPGFILYKPKLHRVKGTEVRNIINNLQEGDILLTKHYGYLSSIFTPGEWNHASLYIGNDTVIHSTSIGVHDTDILEFCRVDSIALLRVKDLTESIRSNAIKIAYDMDKQHLAYDFEFSSDNGTIYCTELINDCLNNMFNMEFTEIYGRSALTPDSVFNSKLVEKILVYQHKGE